MNHYALMKKHRKLKERYNQLEEENRRLKDELKEEREKDVRQINRELSLELKKQQEFVEDIRERILSLVQGGFIPLSTYEGLFKKKKTSPSLADVL